MKYLIRFKKSDTGSSFVDMQLVQDELIHEYHEVDELSYKEGSYIETYWDESEKKLKQRYVEIPKSETEKLREELKKTNKALQEFLLSQEEDEE